MAFVRFHFPVCKFGGNTSVDKEFQKYIEGYSFVYRNFNFRINSIFIFRYFSMFSPSEANFIPCKNENKKQKRNSIIVTLKKQCLNFFIRRNKNGKIKIE